MNGTQFLVLTYCGNFVNEFMLSEGLYITDVPHLSKLDTTIENHADAARQINKITGGERFPQAYFDNLNKCSLTLMELNCVK